MELSVAAESRPDDLAAWAALDRHQVRVVVLDPLYLALLAGDGTANAANRFEMGPLLLDAARRCLAAGATPVFVHHTSRTGQRLKAQDGLHLTWRISRTRARPGSRGSGSC